MLCTRAFPRDQSHIPSSAWRALQQAPFVGLSPLYAVYRRKACVEKKKATEGIFVSRAFVPKPFDIRKPRGSGDENELRADRKFVARPSCRKV